MSEAYDWISAEIDRQTDRYEQIAGLRRPSADPAAGTPLRYQLCVIIAEALSELPLRDLHRLGPRLSVEERATIMELAIKKCFRRR